MTYGTSGMWSAMRPSHSRGSIASKLRPRLGFAIEELHDRVTVPCLDRVKGAVVPRTRGVRVTSCSGPRSMNSMGEVKVRARLANAIDKALVRRGLLAQDQVRTYEAEAVVDTGAVRTVLPRFVAERLGLATVGSRVASYADGRTETVDLVEPFTIEILGREELDDAMVLGDEVLVGQTAIEKMDLLVDCANRRLLPNPAHPDQPVSKIR